MTTSPSKKNKWLILCHNRKGLQDQDLDMDLYRRRQSQRQTLSQIHPITPTPVNPIPPKPQKEVDVSDIVKSIQMSPNISVLQDLNVSIHM